MATSLRSRITGATLLALIILPATASRSAEKVVLKNGLVYHGTIDRDNTIVWIFDGLRRVVTRDSKIGSIEPDSTFGTWEIFKLVQPLVQHAGVMPKEAFDISSTPWNDRGRRSFTYTSARSSKPVTMEQAIYEMGPYLVKIRGVDGFWQEGRLSTTQVPQDVILAILAKVDQTNLQERRRVASFLIQARWFAEARRELNSLLRDFPEEPGLKETIESAQVVVSRLEAVERKAEIDIARKAQQYTEVQNRLKSFPSKDVSSDILVGVRDELRAAENEQATNKSWASELKALADALPTHKREAWKKPVAEVLKGLNEVPDVVHDRLVAWQKAKVEGQGNNEEWLALAMSGYLLGSDGATTKLDLARSFWKARGLLHDYLSSEDQEARTRILDELEAFELPEEPGKSLEIKRLDLLTRLAVRMAPPLASDSQPSKEEVLTHKAADDGNSVPTEYSVLLPPEYHPLRNYPAVVALHGGAGPQSAIDWWSKEASRRGYIVIAPEYNLPDHPKEYRFTTSEHAAVELALRDARRRYAIDANRVFLGGQMIGGDMAWDFGLAHPDLFAGVAIVSGRPFKYAFRNIVHTEKLPLYVAMGDLAPASTELVFGSLLKPLIARAYDITYVEHIRRGLEDLPEEAAPILDWMDRKTRQPVVKAFEAISSRDSDERFYGVVIREFQPGYTTAPEAAEPLGKNLNPASIKVTSSQASNLIQVQAKGVKRLDVWISPKILDFSKKLEVRVNGRPYLKGLVKPTLEPFLEDLRIRGDRQQIYWHKVSAG